MISNTVNSIRQRTKVVPKIALVLGSGLGRFAERIEDPDVLDYRDIPRFAHSTAPGHKGRLVFGTLSGKPVVCMQGRFHYYEGHPLSDIAYPIRVMKALGADVVILTNAAGGVNPRFSAGDVMMIEDHINFMGINPLIGPNDESVGPRFPDMTYAYDPALRELAFAAACKCRIPLRRGVYLGCTGPSFETPAEIRAFRLLGADAVGMSTVPEVIAANHCGMQVLAFSLTTNLAAGVLDRPLSGEEVNTIGERKSGEMERLITAVIEAL